MSSHAGEQSRQSSQSKTKRLETDKQIFPKTVPVPQKMSRKMLTGLSLGYFQTNHCLTGIVGLPEGLEQFAITVEGGGNINPT